MLSLLAIILVSGIVCFVNIWLGIIISVLGLLLYWFILRKVVNKSYTKEDIIRTILNDSLEGDFEVTVENDIQIRKTVISELIEKPIDKVSILPNKLLTHFSRDLCEISEVTAYTETNNGDGKSHKSTVFDGFVAYMLLDSLVDSGLNLQIKPISKVGRMLQDTVSGYSSKLSDIPFSNEELNDKMKMYVDTSIFNKSDMDTENVLKVITGTVEELVYKLYKVYGSFYLDIHAGRLLVGLPRTKIKDVAVLKGAVSLFSGALSGIIQTGANLYSSLEGNKSILCNSLNIKDLNKATVG